MTLLVNEGGCECNNWRYTNVLIRVMRVVVMVHAGFYMHANVCCVVLMRVCIHHYLSRTLQCVFSSLSFYYLPYHAHCTICVHHSYSIHKTLITSLRCCKGPAHRRWPSVCSTTCTHRELLTPNAERKTLAMQTLCVIVSQTDIFLVKGFHFCTE